MKMERVSSKENFLLAYATHRAYESPVSPVRSSDVDFNDVFGGPPRRFSLHENRYSSDGGRECEETSLFLSLSGEKPVFGEESSASRRKNGRSRDFFDDIFKGGKSSSSPRSEFMSSLPGSRVMSPSKPLPPKSEPFGTSLPAHFSLPATLTKAMDYPTFGSSSSLRKRESNVSGISTPSSSLSRFSSQTMPVQDDVKSDVVSPLNGQGPLSNELSLGNEELSYGDKSNEENIRRNLRDDLKATEAPTSINEFHFSIYKWASSGVPITMPLRKGISSKPKARVTSSSSKGSVQNDAVGEFLQPNICSTDTHSISVKSEFSKMECEEIAKTITLKGAEPDVLDTTQVTAEKILDSTLLSNKKEQTTPNSLPEMGFSEKTVNVFTVIGEDRKPMLKPLRSILRDDIEGEENENIVMKVEGKGNVTKTTELSHSNVAASKDVKKHGGKIINSDKTEMSKAISQGSPSSPGGNTKRNGVRGKVKDFVKIFNQEPSSKIQSNASKTQSNADPHNMSGRWEGNVSGTKLNEESSSTTEMDLQKPLPVDKIQDIFFKEGENVGKPEKHHPHKKSTISTSIDISSGPKEDLPKSFQSQMKSTISKGFDNSSELKESPPTSFQSQMKSTVSTNNDSSSDQTEASQFSDFIPDGPTVARGSIDDPFQVNFLIQELPGDQIKPSQTSEEREAIKALDAKIHKWSSGKKGNIRSLLSTLQYVLWAESGWKPVPLVNIIEGNAVKRAYQKAMLCLHPDKLQQKGASSIQKYNAEKVFDILQEAWDHFSTLGSI